MRVSALPVQIRGEPTVLRGWAHDWEVFNTSIDEGVAWRTLPGCADADRKSTDFLAEREDKTLPKFNMKIEGEAAYDVMTLNTFLTDEKTQEQEEIWKTRESRKLLNNPERMRRRRKQVVDEFLKRHDSKRRIHV